MFSEFVEFHNFAEFGNLERIKNSFQNTNNCRTVRYENEKKNRRVPKIYFSLIEMLILFDKLQKREKNRSICFTIRTTGLDNNVH